MQLTGRAVCKLAIDLFQGFPINFHNFLTRSLFFSICQAYGKHYTANRVPKTVHGMYGYSTYYKPDNG